MNQLEKALNIAMDAYKGVKDKSGYPMLYHSLQVAMNVYEATEGDEEMTIIAVFHDLYEDTGYPPSLIASEFGEEIANCIEILTREKDEDYFKDYLPRVRANEKCRQIKLRDNLSNTQDWRMNKLDPREADRLRQKYEKAWNYLLYPESLSDDSNGSLESCTESSSKKSRDSHLSDATGLNISSETHQDVYSKGRDEGMDS